MRRLIVLALGSVCCHTLACAMLVATNVVFA